MHQPHENLAVRAHNRYSVAVIGARILVGTALLTRPRTLLTAVSGQPADENVVVFARVLGARHLVEAAILWRWTTPTVIRAGAAVDATHAASAVALIKTRHHPRLAALNVASASTFALLGVTLARRIGGLAPPTRVARDDIESDSQPALSLVRSGCNSSEV